MNRCLLLLLLISSLIACSKQNDNTAKQKATNSKEPTIEFFAACDKLYKDPKATQDDIDSCRIGIYEKDPKEVLKGADSCKLEEVVISYWNQREGFKAIDLIDAIESKRNDEEKEYVPNLRELLENLAFAKFELADYYIEKKEYKKAYDLLQELSSIDKNGKADVTYALAYLYFNGLGVDKNEEKAKRILDRLTVNDSVCWGTKKYIVHAINSLQEGADKNDSFSRYLLAQIYENEQVNLKMYYGYGCSLAYDELNKAVQNGYAPAMHYLARFYWDDVMESCGNQLGEDGNGIFDSEKALELYTTAANKGYVPSQVMLGDVYGLGSFGTEPDPKLSFKWYSKAAESNDPDALYALIRVYYNGEGTPTNYKKAFEYAQRIKDVEPRALVWLGKMYFYGKGTKQDYKKAFEVLNQWKSADGERFYNRYNYENAYYLLGVMYQKGLGTKQDLEKAKEYFKDIGKDYLMATDETYPAEFLLRNFVENNNPQAKKALENKNLQKPAETMLELAEKAYAGDPDAMYQLGVFLDENKYETSLFYPEGAEDVKTDCEGAFVTEAYKWIKKAAEQGNADAQFMLGEAYETGVIPRGTAWWFGPHCMTNPIVISKDENLAQKWYKKASQQGHLEAQKKLACTGFHTESTDNIQDLCNFAQHAPTRK